jgi:type II secretory pathway component PulK
MTRHRQSGYVLVVVLAAIAVMALVAGRLSSRIDELRDQVGALKNYASARIEADSAYHESIYALITGHVSLAGYGMGAAQLRADGRRYQLASGVTVRVQDERGLLPLNAVERGALVSTLKSLGVDSREADSMVDVLLDYTDTDNLKRLNGAEASDYLALGLAPPRNDWLMSTQELSSMPIWREKPDVVLAIQPLVSIGRAAIFNPNTMPADLIKALAPGVETEDVQRFLTLRDIAPFPNEESALRTSGIAFRGQDFMFHASDRLTLSISAPGLPYTLRYNVVLTPGGSRRPWQVLSIERAPRVQSPDEQITEPSSQFPRIHSAPPGL